GVLRVESDGLGAVGNRPVVFPLLIPRQAAVVEGDDIRRVESDGLVEILDGLVPLLLLDPNGPPAGVGCDVLGVESECLGVVGDRLVVLPLVVPCPPAVVDGRMVIRLHPDGLVVLTDRRVLLAVVCPRIAQAEVPLFGRDHGDGLVGPVVGLVVLRGAGSVAAGPREDAQREREDRDDQARRDGSYHPCRSPCWRSLPEPRTGASGGRRLGTVSVPPYLAPVTSHSLTFLDSHPAASVLPSGLNARECTLPPFPSKVCWTLPVSTSHTVIVPKLWDAASLLPSRLYVTKIAPP